MLTQMNNTNHSMDE